MRIRALLLTAVTVAGLGVAGASPASAFVDWTWDRTFTDTAGDAAPRADIRKVRIELDDAGWRFRSEVAKLRTFGTYRVRLPVGPNVRRVIVVSKVSGHAPRGVVKVSKRLADGSWSPYTATRCRVGVRWDAAANVVSATAGRPGCSSEYAVGQVSLTAGGSHDVVATSSVDPVLERLGYTDTAGDAAPGADIRKLVVTFTPGAMWTTTRIADLKGSGSQDFDVLGARNSYRVHVEKAEGQAPRASLWQDGDELGETQVPCAMKVTWNAVDDVVTVQTPYRCASALTESGRPWPVSLSFRRGTNVDELSMFD